MCFTPPDFTYLKKFARAQKVYAPIVAWPIYAQFLYTWAERKKWPWAGHGAFFLFAPAYQKTRAGDESVDFHFLFFNFLCIMCAHKWVWGRSLSAPWWLIAACARCENWLAKQKADASSEGPRGEVQSFLGALKKRPTVCLVFIKRWWWINIKKREENWPCHIKRSPSSRVCAFLDNVSKVCVFMQVQGWRFLFMCVTPSRSYLASCAQAFLILT